MKTRQEAFEFLIKTRIESSENTIEKFKTGLDKDPLYTLHWSRDVFAAAARLYVWKHIENAATGDEAKTPGDIVHFLSSHVLNEAKYPQESTSPTANLAETYKLAEYAKAIDDLKSFVGE